MNPLLDLAPPEVWREVFAWSARGPPRGRERGSRALEEVLYLAWTRFRAEVKNEIDVREFGAVLARYGAAGLRVEVECREVADRRAGVKATTARYLDMAAVLEPASGGWTRRVASLRVAGCPYPDRPPVPVLVFGTVPAGVVDPRVVLRKFTVTGRVAVDPTFVAAVAAGRWEAWPWNLCGHSGVTNLAPRAETFALRSCGSAGLYVDPRLGGADTPRSFNLVNRLTVTRRVLHRIRQRLLRDGLDAECRAMPINPKSFRFPDPPPLRFSRVDIGCEVQGAHLGQLYAAADALDCTSGFSCGRPAEALLRAARAKGGDPGDVPAVRFRPGSVVDLRDESWEELIREFPNIVAEIAVIGEEILTDHLAPLVAAVRKATFDHYALSKPRHHLLMSRASLRDLTLVSTRANPVEPCLCAFLPGSLSGLRRLRLVFAHSAANEGETILYSSWGSPPSRFFSAGECMFARLEKIECSVADTGNGFNDNFDACMATLDFFRDIDVEVRILFFGPADADELERRAEAARSAGWHAAKFGTIDVSGDAGRIATVVARLRKMKGLPPAGFVRRPIPGNLSWSHFAAHAILADRGFAAAEN